MPPQPAATFANRLGLVRGPAPVCEQAFAPSPQGERAENVGLMQTGGGPVVLANLVCRRRINGVRLCRKSPGLDPWAIEPLTGEDDGPSHSV